MGGPAFEIRRAATRFRTDAPGRHTWHSFSFGEHFDPDNVGFGPLLAHNDDHLEPGAGYEEHSHRNVEIISWLVKGSLAHADSSGQRGIARVGAPQRMSAGSGIVHTERNDGVGPAPAGPFEPTHLVQVWLRPDTSGHAPSYAQAEFDPAGLDRGWLAVAAGPDQSGLITVDCRGAVFWATRLATGQGRTVPDAELRHLYLARGRVFFTHPGDDGVTALGDGDAVRIRGRGPYGIRATSDAEVLVWTFEEGDG